MLAVLQTFIDSILFRRNIMGLSVTVTQKCTALQKKASNNIAHNINLQYDWAESYRVK
jgi:hypothetical protein